MSKNMVRTHEIRRRIYLVLAAIGLVTALVFNGMASVQGQNYLDAWFGQPVDWVLSLDLLIVALAVVTFMIAEAKRLGIKRVWVYFALSAVTAMAFTFPLFMAARERRILSRKLAGGRIDSFEFDGHRVDVWVPVEQGAPSADHPVLVMHDGRNVFFESEAYTGTTWGVLDAVRGGELGSRPPIVVAVWGLGDQTRFRELAPEAIMRKRPEFWDGVGPDWIPTGTSPLGDAYLSLVSDAVLPFVAERYDLQLAPERTAIMGASMGGLASMYFVTQRPDVFGTALCFSTHWMLGYEEMARELVAALPRDGKHRVWTDAGDIDIDAYYRDSHLLAQQLLEQAGYSRPDSLAGTIVPHTGHHERYWARRVADAVNWWLRS
jgi:predicted alpha/beta superfamily hydrolase